MNSCKICSLLSKRSFSTTALMRGRRGKIPWNIKFPIFPDDVAADKVGGSESLPELIAKSDPFHPQQPGYTDDKGQFHVVPEMIPEFVVPDLKDFKLKPYVSFRAPDVKQAEFTDYDLFRAVYGQRIVDNYQKNNVTIDDLENAKKSGDLQSVISKK